ncbi:hypothetical protein MLD38_024691 [Melastoma candidum]|uniref:Uncharacterized protein n=1 Tax=Melastoma candidum TaxID=119954 RepID=A0ACB9NTE6_9MYRT|nr:hypothetical protein MLD38_024691 [Melastoma candidum]
MGKYRCFLLGFKPPATQNSEKIRPSPIESPNVVVGRLDLVERCASDFKELVAGLEALPRRELLEGLELLPRGVRFFRISRYGAGLIGVLMDLEAWCWVEIWRDEKPRVSEPHVLETWVVYWSKQQ